MTQSITHISVNVEDFKMTSNRTIPFYKSAADGKTLYFSRKELEEWCLKNHFKPLYQLADEHIENLGNKKSTF